MRSFHAPVFVLLATFGFPAGAAPLLEVGDAAEITEDGLHRVALSIMDAAWVRPGLDLTPYNSVYVRRTGVSFRSNGDQQSGAVPDDLRPELRSAFEQAFRDEFSRIGGIPASTVPGRRIVMAQGFLVDVSMSRQPGETGTEMIQNLSWEATIVLELRDSMSDAILARSVERERIEDVIDSNFVRAQIGQLAQRWARLLHTRFDELVSISR
ncbi:MAG TPA: hypothetical protein VLD39_12720 [Gammaproteobacteria bacterium]|nr:hypothetical protein [Gammaproteobacteria bacterium]